jgi:hypothetical protein
MRLCVIEIVLIGGAVTCGGPPAPSSGEGPPVMGPPQADAGSPSLMDDAGAVNDAGGPTPMMDSGVQAPPDAGGPGPHPGVNVWWIGATSTAPEALQNIGVRTTVDAFQAPPDGGCLSYFTSETLNNGIWHQAGYKSCILRGTPMFYSFYQVWRGGTELATGALPALTAGPHTFSIYRWYGTTWAYAIDGLIFGAYDTGALTSDAVSQVVSCYEESDGVLAQFTPPATSVTEAISVLPPDGGWIQAGHGQVYNPEGGLGVIGSAQDSSLLANQMVMGGASVVSPSGTTLWAGGVKPSTAVTAPAGTDVPYVQLVAPPGGTEVSGNVFLHAIADSPSVITSAQFTVDGTLICRQTAAPFGCTWDSTRTANGRHVLEVIGVDGAHRAVTAEVFLSVHN